MALGGFGKKTIGMLDNFPIICPTGLDLRKTERQKKYLKQNTSLELSGASDFYVFVKNRLLA